MAYVDEVEEREGSQKSQKVYYSVLVKAVKNLDQVSIPLFPEAVNEFISVPWFMETD